MECHGQRYKISVSIKISEARDINGAIAVFKEAINNAHGSKPEKY